MMSESHEQVCLVLIHIEDASDARLAPYRNVKEKDLVGREHFFMAEGEVVLTQLVQSNIMEVVSVFILASRVETLAENLEKLPKEIPVYTTSQAVMDGIVGFHIHRGVLALGKRKHTPTGEELLTALPSSCIVLGLVDVSNHDNMGGIFRNAAAFGVDAVILDSSCCDPLYRKAIRVSVGAALKIPCARLKPGEDMVAVFQQYKLEPIALSPSGRIELNRLQSPTRTGLLLGAEGPGLPDKILSRCNTVRITMANGFDSLNVATTAGIALHHLNACTKQHRREIV